MAINGVTGGSFTVRRVADGISATSVLEASEGFTQVFNASTGMYLSTNDWSVNNNIITPSLIVNGEIRTTGITARVWEYRRVDTGAWQEFPTTPMGVTINAAVLTFTANLDQTDTGEVFNVTNYPGGISAGGIVTLRFRFEFTDGTRTGLESYVVQEFRRNELSESSISYWVMKSAGPYFSVADFSDKSFEARVFIGGTEVLTNITYQWTLTNPGGNIVTSQKDVTVTRAQVVSNATLTLRITQEDIGMNVLVETFELFDLLDPIQIIERVENVVGENTQASGTLVPFQNGAPMGGLTAANSEWRFRLIQVTDITENTWDFDTTPANRGSAVDGTRVGNTFTAGYFQDDEVTPATADANARVYRTATQQDVFSTQDGANLNVTAAELEAKDSNVRVDYEFELFGFNG